MRLTTRVLIAALLVAVAALWLAHRTPHGDDATTAAPCWSAEAVALARHIQYLEGTGEDYFAHFFLSRSRSLVSLLEYSWYRKWFMAANDALYGTYGALARREAFGDAEWARAAPHVDFIVVLGCGYDTRSLRMPAHGARIIEVDVEPILAARTASLHDAYDVPRRAVSVAHHLSGDTHALHAALRAAGWDATAPTLVLVQGVLPYLPRDTADGLLAWLATTLVGPSRLVFDVVCSDEIGMLTTAAHAARGEPLHFTLPRARLPTLQLVPSAPPARCTPHGWLRMCTWAPTPVR